MIDQFHHPECADILILSNVIKDGAADRPRRRRHLLPYRLLVSGRACTCTTLYSIVVPKVGGDTLFANQYAAYDDLPATMKARIENLVGLHHYGNRDDLNKARARSRRC